MKHLIWAILGLPVAVAIVLGVCLWLVAIWLWNAVRITLWLGKGIARELRQRL